MKKMNEELECKYIKMNEENKLIKKNLSETISNIESLKMEFNQ